MSDKLTLMQRIKLAPMLIVVWIGFKIVEIGYKIKKGLHND